MKKSEALAILRDARSTYDQISRHTPDLAKEISPIRSCVILALYAVYGPRRTNDPWRWDIFPLYQALMLAGPSLYKVVNRDYPHISIIDKFRVLLRVSIQILHDGQITWPQTLPA